MGHGFWVAIGAAVLGLLATTAAGLLLHLVQSGGGKARARRALMEDLQLLGLVKEQTPWSAQAFDRDVGWRVVAYERRWLGTVEVPEPRLWLVTVVSTAGWVVFLGAVHVSGHHLSTLQQYEAAGVAAIVGNGVAYWWARRRGIRARHSLRDNAEAPGSSSE
jgi:hypothetical protein